MVGGQRKGRPHPQIRTSPSPRSSTRSKYRQANPPGWPGGECATRGEVISNMLRSLFDLHLLCNSRRNFRNGVSEEGYRRRGARGQAATTGRECPPVRMAAPNRESPHRSSGATMSSAVCGGCFRSAVYDAMTSKQSGRGPGEQIEGKEVRAPALGPDDDAAAITHYERPTARARASVGRSRTHVCREHVLADMLLLRDRNGR